MKESTTQPESELLDELEDLLESAGADHTTPHARHARDLMRTTMGLLDDGRTVGELKLMSGALRELRQAHRVFAGYPSARKVSIFGSARTPPGHPDYAAATEFSRAMAARGWLVITGAGDGIMRAGHEGPGAQSSFGLAIRLPFETTANDVIAGDEKLITFRYFFTRKVMFLSQSDAVAAFPGGFGTQDELMECLTLVQTGKSQIVPIVLIEGPGSTYWARWDHYVHSELAAGGFISADDRDLYLIAADPQEAAQHIGRFYANYHSSRYVGDDLVLRIRHPLTSSEMARLNDEFGSLVKEGRIRQCGPYRAEREHLELPRIAFTHTRRSMGTVRRLIDRINEAVLVLPE